MIFVLSQTPILKGDSRKGENLNHLVDGQIEDDILQAAIFALTAFFRSLKLTTFIKFLLYYSVEQFCNVSCCRGGGKVGKKAVEQNYASVLAELTLQLGSCHGLASAGHHEPLR